MGKAHCQPFRTNVSVFLNVSSTLPVNGCRNKIAVIAHDHWFTHFYHLRVCISLELFKGSLVQENLSMIADVFANGRGVQDAPPRYEQAVNHVRVVVHGQRKESLNRENRKIVFSLIARIDDTMLLPVLELRNLRSETFDFASNVWKYVVLRRNGKTIHVDVRSLARDAVRNRSHLAKELCSVCQP